MRGSAVLWVAFFLLLCVAWSDGSEVNYDDYDNYEDDILTGLNMTESELPYYQTTTLSASDFEGIYEYNASYSSYERHWLRVRHDEQGILPDRPHGYSSIAHDLKNWQSEVDRYRFDSQPASSEPPDYLDWANCTTDSSTQFEQFAGPEVCDYYEGLAFYVIAPLCLALLNIFLVFVVLPTWLLVRYCLRLRRKIRRGDRSTIASSIAYSVGNTVSNTLAFTGISKEKTEPRKKVSRLRKFKSQMFQKYEEKRLTVLRYALLAATVCFALVCWALSVQLTGLGTVSYSIDYTYSVLDTALGFSMSMTEMAYNLLDHVYLSLNQIKMYEELYYTGMPTAAAVLAGTGDVNEALSSMPDMQSVYDGLYAVNESVSDMDVTVAQLNEVNDAVVNISSATTMLVMGLEGLQQAGQVVNATAPPSAAGLIAMETTYGFYPESMSIGVWVLVQQLSSGVSSADRADVVADLDTLLASMDAMTSVQPANVAVVVLTLDSVLKQMPDPGALADGIVGLYSALGLLPSDDSLVAELESAATSSDQWQTVTDYANNVLVPINDTIMYVGPSTDTTMDAAFTTVFSSLGSSPGSGSSGGGDEGSEGGGGDGFGSGDATTEEIETGAATDGETGLIPYTAESSTGLAVGFSSLAAMASPVSALLNVELPPDTMEIVGWLYEVDALIDDIGDLEPYGTSVYGTDVAKNGTYDGVVATRNALQAWDGASETQPNTTAGADAVATMQSVRDVYFSPGPAPVQNISDLGAAFASMPNMTSLIAGLEDLGAAADGIEGETDLYVETASAVLEITGQLPSNLTSDLATIAAVLAAFPNLTDVTVNVETGAKAFAHYISLSEEYVEMVQDYREDSDPDMYLLDAKHMMFILLLDAGVIFFHLAGYAGIRLHLAGFAKWFAFFGIILLTVMWVIVCIHMAVSMSLSDECEGERVEDMIRKHAAEQPIIVYGSEQTYNTTMVDIVNYIFYCKDGLSESAFEDMAVVSATQLNSSVAMMQHAMVMMDSTGAAVYDDVTANTLNATVTMAVTLGPLKGLMMLLSCDVLNTLYYDVKRVACGELLDGTSLTWFGMMLMTVFSFLTSAFLWAGAMVCVKKHEMGPDGKLRKKETRFSIAGFELQELTGNRLFAAARTSQPESLSESLSDASGESDVGNDVDSDVECGGEKAVRRHAESLPEHRKSSVLLRI